MKKLIGAVALGFVALFMFVGFLNSDAGLSEPATVAALALVVGLPAAGAVLLVRSHRAERDRTTGRKALLRQQTIDAEVLRIAGEHGGRLTAVEVATLLGLSPEDAKASLDGLAVRDQADIAVTDEGVLVYTFHDVRHIGGKSSARNVLDA